MQSFVFRDERSKADAMARLQRRVIVVLQRRLAMHIGELCRRIGEDESRVRRTLETMIESGEVEMLRPVNYTKDDHDFFASVRSLENARTDERLPLHRRRRVRFSCSRTRSESTFHVWTKQNATAN